MDVSQCSQVMCSIRGLSGEANNCLQLMVGIFKEQVLAYILGHIVHLMTRVGKNKQPKVLFSKQFTCKASISCIIQCDS
jgi:hypothetical protein